MRREPLHDENSHCGDTFGIIRTVILHRVKSGTGHLENESMPLKRNTETYRLLFMPAAAKHTGNNNIHVMKTGMKYYNIAL